MRRVPSIHITEENLRIILDSITVHPLGDRYFKKIITEARKVSCDNRVVMISNDKLKREVAKVLKSNKGDTNLMSTVLYSVRKKMKHKGIQRSKEGSKEWKQIKQLSALALDFSNDFELGKRAGFILYITMGFKRMSSYRNHITKMINMFEVISLMYEAQTIIDDDDRKTETLSVHNEYVGMIAMKTGITESYVEDPINYVNFIKVREITDKYKVPVDIYIEAQFDQLEWTSGYPSPVQLSSDKAIERLNKFMYQNKLKIQVDEGQKETKGLQAMLNKLKDGNYTD